MRHTRILYIEDDPDQLELVQMFLEKNLPDVMVDVRCTVTGAEEALNMRCYDLIISDVDLPGELGTAIAARILERDPQQPIVLISEYVADSVKHEAHRLGLTIDNKFSSNHPSDFLQKVSEMLKKRPCADRVAVASTSVRSAESSDRIRDQPARTVTGRSQSHSSDCGHGSCSRACTRRISLTSPYVLAARAGFAH